MIDYGALAERWTRLVWNERRADVIDAMMSPACRVHVEGVDNPLTRDDFRHYNAVFLQAVPDLFIEVQSAVANGGKVVTQWRATGTHTGPGLGITPTNRPVDIAGLTLFEFEGELIVGGEDRWNRGEFLASLLEPRVEQVRADTGLTEREAQVAILMAERLTHKEIASHLGISPNTARRHWERVMQRLRVTRYQDVPRAIGRIQDSVLRRHGADLRDSGGQSP